MVDLLQETAIQIAYASKLFAKEQEVITLNAHSKVRVQNT